ncbi:hypothetical protein WJX72_001977 [[Myrmecia] bisecta]|uniref:Micro-fibrillar-associated protein 1 C-terminal domain-containing protein n=1 Tax=[Myrmecia] bisecta TaxID=41462 RepID=A0AAW1Q0M0_9CHLO
MLRQAGARAGLISRLPPACSRFFADVPAQSAEAGEAPVPRAGEVGVCSGAPQNIYKRKVLIYAPARTACQQGQSKTTEPQGKGPGWKIEFDTQEKWINPLIGWTSTADPLENVGRAALDFRTQDDAVAFCDKHGWQYELRAPKHPRKDRSKRFLGYGDNFSVKRQGFPLMPTAFDKKGSSESDESEASDEEEGKGEEEEDEEELEARRAAVREKLKKRQQQEEELLGEGDEEEEESEEGSSEYETDSDDEEYGRQMLKPVFVPKKERETIAEREAMLKEEEAEFEKNKQRLEERKTETKELVLERIKLDEATARSAKEGPKELGDIDTDDDKDEEVEYEQWKSREMRRIRRERDAKETEAREAEEREMFKKMSAEERAQWERDHPKEVDKAPRKNLKFLQKYWHQGAFFQQASDTNPSEKQVDGIYRRDFSAPTGEDKMDKTVLPKIMQVKNFGRRGRTKYTHLVDQDTTEFDNPLEPDAALRAKYEKKMAGTKDVFAAPKHTR